MYLYSNEKYMEDVRCVASLDLPWEKLSSKSVLITGSTGLIGSFLIDVLCEKNEKEDMDCKIYAIGRNKTKLKERFDKHIQDERLVFMQSDVKDSIEDDEYGDIDYVVHLASNTHPILYSSDPIGTILTNVFGLKNLLDFAIVHHSKRFAFASSNEIYGENRGDKELFDENYCGFINCNTVRAGYPESKRCGEALCQAYISQKGLDIVIPRFTRSYGPTMSMTDSKAVSQFIKNGIRNEDIVLKSAGTQYYSYTYVADAVSGLLTVILNGKTGEAYNIADESGDITLKDLASVIANYAGRSVIFETPDRIEAAGFSTATKARLSGNKLHNLGWQAKYNIKDGIERTISILRSNKNEMVIGDRIRHQANEVDNTHPI